ncbi:hypothetical protein RhiJN_17951 [Ceratobasidium sp. AG-Ba]|nr:hypothetical protein RhiJN_17951 [Ceratobasidium sp. AG-Ba]
MGLPGVARGYKTRWDPSSFFLTSIVLSFKMLDLLVLATIIGSLIPRVPVPHSLAPSHNATVAGLPRMPFGNLGRTFTSYVGDLLPAGGLPLAPPDFWSSKPPVRRTVCTSHGLRLAATPAQCLAIVSAQLGIPSPTDLTLSPPVALLTLPARRPLLTLPAAPRLVFLALPAAIHAPILMLPAAKRVPVLTLPAPKLRLTLSRLPNLIPALAVLLPAIDNLYILPFPTCHGLFDLVDIVLDASVRQGRYSRPRRELWLAGWLHLDRARSKVCVGTIRLWQWYGSYTCLVGTVADSSLDGLSSCAGWASTDAPDGLDIDSFVPISSVTHRRPIPSLGLFDRDHELATATIEGLAVSTEASVGFGGEESPMSEDANSSASCDVSEDSTASNDIVEETSSTNTSVSSFAVALEAEHIGGEDALETGDIAPLLELAPEAFVIPPALVTPSAPGSVSDESRDNCAQDEGPEVGSSDPNPGPDDEATNGPRRRGKRGGRRVRKRRENALGGGDEESSAGAEGSGEVEQAGGDGANGDGVSEKRERGFSSGIWFSHKRRREKRG